MPYGNWSNRSSGASTPMEAAYGKFGDAISGTGIINNYYDAVAQYREAQRQAFANMAKVLKENADKQSMTSSPSVIAQPRNMGNMSGYENIKSLPKNAQKEIPTSTASSGASDTSAVPMGKEVKDFLPLLRSGASDTSAVPMGKGISQIPSLQKAIGTSSEISGPIRLTMEGSGGTQIQDVPMGNYYNDQLQSYAGTKKGMADFMNQLMAIEANQGTRMDMTGNFAMQDPNEIRKTSPSGIPSMQNLLSMPEDINKQRINLQNEALSKEELFNSQRAEQTIAELIAKYPQAHAALQNGTLTIDANGAFKYNNEKSPGASADARNEIAKFIGETGTLGKYYTASIDKGGQGFKREYNAVYAPGVEERPYHPRDDSTFNIEDQLMVIGPEGEEIPWIKVEYKKGDEGNLSTVAKIQFIQRGVGTDASPDQILFKPHEIKRDKYSPYMVDKFEKQSDGSYKKVAESINNEDALKLLKDMEAQGYKTTEWHKEGSDILVPNGKTQDYIDAGRWVKANKRNNYNAQIVRASKHEGAKPKSNYDIREQKGYQDKKFGNGWFPNP
jgi:hypothetical protein